MSATTQWEGEGKIERHSGNTGGKLEHGQSQLGIRKLFFTVTVVKHWKMLAHRGCSLHSQRYLKP